MTIWLLLWAVVPADRLPQDHVTTIEINHFYSETGVLVFTQLIYWDWNPDLCCEDVRAWRLAKHASALPRKSPSGGYTTTFWDGDVLRTVTSDSVRETWTQYDVELEARELLPKEHRKELTLIRPWPKRK